MLSINRVTRSVFILVLALLLLVGCSTIQYNPGDDATTGNPPRTFAISDVYPYPGAGYQIQDKQVNQPYTVYIYVINNGNIVKGNSAENVKLSLIDETHSQTTSLGSTTIDGDVGYAVFSDLTPNEVARVHLHVEGYIDKNKNHQIFVAVNSDSFNINNPPAVLQSITIGPANPTIQVGLTQTFTATANYSNGTTKDVSDTAAWSSSDVKKTTMSGNVATGVSPGTSNISASEDGQSGTTKLTIAAPVLQSILVTPTDASVEIGKTQSYSAKAIYSNGTSTDVSGQVTWASTQQAVATMTDGVAAGVAVGSATITAAYGGKTGTANLTVVEPPNENLNDRLIWEKEVVEP